MSQTKYTKLMSSLLHCKGQVVNSQAEQKQQESQDIKLFHLMKFMFLCVIWSSQGTDSHLA